jgi:AraC-like DNA-binding protein
MAGSSCSFTAAPAALVDFVLHHGRLNTHVCTRQRMAGGYRMAERIIDDYNLLFVQRGRFVWVINDRAVELNPCDLLVVWPGVPHHAFSRGRNVSLTSLHVTLQLPGGQDAFRLIEPAECRPVPTDSRLADYLLGATREFDRPANERQLAMPGWAHLIVHELIRHDAGANLLRQGVADPLIADLLEYLAEHLGDRLGLADLARWSGYSAQHLNRLCREALGLTPLQYLMQMRMERARAMLSDCRLTVAAIGQAVGFDDPYYFSRAFKQQTGLSPRQYQQRSCSDSP